MPLIPTDAAEISVYLAKSVPPVAAGGQQIALYIIPDRSNWNDFSANFRAALHIIGPDMPQGPFQMRLMIEGFGRPQYRLDQLRVEANAIDIAVVPEAYCSVLAEEESYRTLVMALGFDRAVTAFRKMHDAVVAQIEGGAADTLRLSNSKEFHQTGLRDEKSWAALRQGSRHLRPVPIQEVGDAAISFEARVQLPGMAGEHVLDADLTSEPPLARRSLVLVGKNGTGKTRLLRSIIDGLRTGAAWPDLRGDGPAATFDPAPAITRVVMMSSVHTDQYPRVIEPWSGLDYRYHSMVGANAEPALDDLTVALVDCLRSDPDGEHGPGGAMDLLDEVLEPLGIAKTLFVRMREADQPDMLPPLIRRGGIGYLPVFGITGEQRRLQFVSRIDVSAPPVVWLPGGIRRDLSSGELALLRFAAQAIASVKRGTLFLFDEPETHLHPNYISMFMSMLDRLLDSTRSIAVIATHSAYVVREVPSRRVRLLALEGKNREVHVDPPGFQTFGSSIDMISQFVFGDIAPKHRYQEILADWVAAQGPELTVEAMRAQIGEELNAETLSYLASVIRKRGEENA